MFITRLISGIILVILAIATMGYGSWLLLATLSILSIVGFLELTRASGVRKGEKGKQNLLEKMGVLGCIIYYTVLGITNYNAWEPHFYMLMVVIGMFFAVMFVYVFFFPDFQSEQVMSALFCFLYAPVCLSFIYLTRNLPGGLYTVWLILICSWGCDTCAYAIGVLFGKHKMSPILSPKKSVEGAIGGIAGAAALGAIYGAFLEEQAVSFAIICACGALISMVGDLAASAIKRNHDIKDYGKLIPGHGGVMDRFDSVIFTAPVIYFMASIILK